MTGEGDLGELRAALRTAGAGGLRQPRPELAVETCLLLAKMLIDPAYLELVVTGRHPVTGIEDDHPLQARFAGRVEDLRRRLGGPARPWTAARQLSWTSREARDPTRYLWYPARWRRWHLYDRMCTALHDDRPVLLHLGDSWRMRHAVLVVGTEAGSLICFEPGTGSEQPVQRADFEAASLDLGGYSTPWFVVTPTGRRTAH